MKRTILSVLSALILISSGNTTEKVYIGMTNSSNIVLLEDNSYSLNENLWEKDEFGSIYDSYLEYINNFLKKNNAIPDTNGNVIFNKYYSEFSSLTSIQPGEIFYISTVNGIFESKVTGYLIRPEDSHINSNVFYVILHSDNTVPFNDWSPVIISKNPGMSVLKSGEDKSSEIYQKATDIVKKSTLGKEFLTYDYEKDKEVKEKFTDFKEEDFRFFRGKFTQKSTEEFIANFSSRFSFMHYVNATYIIDESGKIIVKIAEPAENDFNYYDVKYIADIDNDGIDEILIDIGYYEGTGLYLHKFDGKEFKIIAEGFIAGV